MEDKEGASNVLEKKGRVEFMEDTKQEILVNLLISVLSR